MSDHNQFKGVKHYTFFCMRCGEKHTKVTKAKWSVRMAVCNNCPSFPKNHHYRHKKAYCHQCGSFLSETGECHCDADPHKTRTACYDCGEVPKYGHVLDDRDYLCFSCGKKRGLESAIPNYTTIEFDGKCAKCGVSINELFCKSCDLELRADGFDYKYQEAVDTNMDALRAKIMEDVS